MALVPGSAYADPGDGYNHILGRNSIAVSSIYPPSSAAYFLRYYDQYLDACRFGAIPSYAHKKKNSQEGPGTTTASTFPVMPVWSRVAAL